MSLFVLEAFEYVHAAHAAEYERRGAAIQAKVKAIEPDMLVHLQTRIATTDTEVTYRWLEVFRNFEGMAAHFDGAHVKEHLRYLNDGVLSRPTDLKLHVDWTAEQKAAWRARVPSIEFVDPVNAFFRTV
ncbi:MAG: hypothetical protein R3F55_25455 [Alphaproteobacteria bacterium]